MGSSSKGMGSCLPSCGQCLMAPGAPYHSVCKAPELVEQEFEEYAEGKEKVMTVRGLTRFVRERQGDSAATEEDVKRKMAQFIDAVMRSGSSRHLRQLGLSNRGSRSFKGSGSSRSAKQELLGPERERAPPTFTLPLFLKFLLNPVHNDHRPPKSVSILFEIFFLCVNFSVKFRFGKIWHGFTLWHSADSGISEIMRGDIWLLFSF